MSSLHHHTNWSMLKKWWWEPWHVIDSNWLTISTGTRFSDQWHWSLRRGSWYTYPRAVWPEAWRATWTCLKWRVVWEGWACGSWDWTGSGKSVKTELNSLVWRSLVWKVDTSGGFLLLLFEFWGTAGSIQGLLRALSLGSLLGGLRDPVF